MAIVSGFGRVSGLRAVEFSFYCVKGVSIKGFQVFLNLSTLNPNPPKP